MTPAEAAAALAAIAERVGRVKPSSSDPERFFVERSELEQEILGIAVGLRRPWTADAPRAKFSAGDVVAGGRRIRAETRGTRARGAGELKKVFG